MLRNSRAITPRNNLLFDAFWSLAGTVSLSGADSSSPLLLLRRAEKADRLATADRLSDLEDHLARRRDPQGRQRQCEGIGKGDPTDSTVRAAAVPTIMTWLFVQFLLWGVPRDNGMCAVLIGLAGRCRKRCFNAPAAVAKRVKQRTSRGVNRLVQIQTPRNRRGGCSLNLHSLARTASDRSAEARNSMTVNYTGGSRHAHARQPRKSCVRRALRVFRLRRADSGVSRPQTARRHGRASVQYF